MRNNSEIPKIGLGELGPTDCVLRKSDNSDAESESEIGTDELTAPESLTGR